MSKALDDLSGRLAGSVAGLVGMKDRVSRPSAGEQPAVPPLPTQEDLAKYKQMIEEAKGIIEAMEKEFEKENPKSDGGSSSSSSGSVPKTKSA